ncbi:MAG: hypothetical protein AAGC96_08465 [Pseudomonadota bacterium]
MGSGMYRESIALFHRLIGWVVIYMSVEMGLQVAELQGVSPWILIVGWSVNWIFLLYLAFRNLLANRLEPSANALDRLFGFALRIVALIFPVMAVALFASLLFAVLLGASPDDNVPAEILDAQNDLDYGVLVVTAQIMWVLLFSLFGTGLPAYLERNRQGFVATFRQGSQAFWQTAGLLIVGPTVFDLLGEGIGMLAMFLSFGEYVSSDAVLPVVSEDWVPNIPIILLVLLRDVCYAFSIILTAWVLSKAYTNAVGNQHMVSVFE